MSRRDSRASLNARQNDALTEFENFKKKFLLANKHITKLNSTLSVRIEELQTEISTLYVENLRLRASEIALAAQLKKEQEKSRKILADTEAAVRPLPPFRPVACCIPRHDSSPPPAQTSNLAKHLGFLRQSLSTTSSLPSPTLEPKPPPKARRPALDPNASPQMPRLSRAPTFPGIYEDDEMRDIVHVNTSRRRAKDKQSSLSLSSSRLPPRPSSPTPPSTPLRVHLVERESSTKRKSSRRQSGLLSVNTDVGPSMGTEKLAGMLHPRAASPALGSPERRSAGLAEDDEERQVDEMIGSGSGMIEELDFAARARKERKEKKSKLVERDIVHEYTDLGTLRLKERKRRKEEEVTGLKDVTNSPRRRTTLPPLDTHTSDRDRQRTPEMDAPTSAATSVTTSRTFLSTPATTPITTPQVSQLPTPRTSSPIPPAATSASESEAPPGGRERRVRKGINYAEPKLNTKMRKPDPVPLAPTTTTASKKRTSTTTSIQNDDNTDGRSSMDGPAKRPVSPLQPPAPKLSTATASTSLTSASSSVKRKKSRPFMPIDDDDESDGTQADAEHGNSTVNGWVNTDGRRRSTNGGTGAGQQQPPQGARSRRRTTKQSCRMTCTKDH
ncbi:hypothetical protein JVT61DRAFT_2726 [Boletus reticuloceps]|uniref:Shugoshin C-terminal domain-containing protein n=1 Tax=Boletus reticuloceps TaxID=495285 RepID=A0A8I3A8I1_9AGAM|nr:hypothetical protein JVT61DRAFT_2726 [Boletus reticuloceps]